MAAFFNLIRFPNLLLIAFTQYVMRYAVILPVANLYGVEFQLSGFTFFCIVLSTMCTAAAGYAINDYFDMKTDNINRPRKVVVGKAINRHKTVMAHGILCAAGVFLGGYVTWMAGIPELALVYIMVAGMLWLYSFTYKRQFLIGNFIVALFSALVPMMTLLDIPPMYQSSGTILLEQGANFNYAVFWILGVAVWVFLTTLSHEIIKDAEAFEGDATYGCRSLPIVMGDQYTKWTIIGINASIVVTLGLIYHFYLRQITGYFSFFYLLLFLIVPIIFISWKVLKASTSDDYRRAGNWMIWVMIAGIAYSGILSSINSVG